MAARAAEAEQAAADAAERSRAAAERFAPVAHLRSVRRADASSLERIVHGAERLDETLRVAAAAAGRLETPLAERAGRLAEELRGISRPRGRAAALPSPTPTPEHSAAERRANGRTAEPGGELAELRLEAEDLTLRAPPKRRRRAEDCGRTRALCGPRPGRRRPGRAPPPE